MFTMNDLLEIIQVVSGGGTHCWIPSLDPSRRRGEESASWPGRRGKCNELGTVHISNSWENGKRSATRPREKKSIRRSDIKIYSMQTLRLLRCIME